MKQIRVDGKIHSFPDDATDEEINGVLAPPDNSALRGVGLGIAEPFDNLAMRASQTDIGKRFIEGKKRLGLVTGGASRREDARRVNTRTGYQMAGNVGASLLTAPLKGGMAVQGALTGAALSDAPSASGVARDAAIGAATSAVGGAATRAIGSAVAPRVNAGIAALRQMKVPLTLGQMAGAAGETAKTEIGKIAGKFVKGAEDRLAGFPLVGDIINNARNRGTIAYNQGVLNRALGTIRGQLPADIEPGRASIRYVGDALDARYKALLPKLSVMPDAPMQSALRAAEQSTQILPDAIQAQYTRMMEKAFRNRAPNSTLAANDLKATEEILNDFAKKYGSAADPDQRGLAEAVGMVRDALRDAVVRQNPRYGRQLQAVNSGWAQLARAETAAGGAGNHNGIFTPKQYAEASRKADPRVRHRGTVRGEAPNQTATDAAASILPNVVPDSGTAGRVALGLGGAAMLSPYAAAGLGAAMLPYTQVGQRGANALIAGVRPPWANSLGNRITQLAPLVGAAAPALTADRR